MTLFDKHGRPELVEECSYPLTDIRCVNRIYTDLAVFDGGPRGTTIRETFGISPAERNQRIGTHPLESDRRKTASA